MSVIFWKLPGGGNWRLASTQGIALGRLPCSLTLGASQSTSLRSASALPYVFLFRGSRRTITPGEGDGLVGID